MRVVVILAIAALVTQGAWAADNMFIFKLLCSNATNCPKEPIFGEDAYFSEQSCRSTAIQIARAMHYKQGGDWAWQCFPADYEPKEIKP